MTLKSRPELTAERLREILSYDPETGIFRWAIKTGPKVIIGAVAGGDDGHGYVTISVEKRICRGHRLAWLYMHGVWPADQIDHINGDRSDNRIANLREATVAENLQNQRVRSTNKSGYPGVYWEPDRGKWRAQIRVKGRNIYLGLHADIVDAVAARTEAKARHHQFNPIDRPA